MTNTEPTPATGGPVRIPNIRPAWGHGAVDDSLVSAQPDPILTGSDPAYNAARAAAEERFFTAASGKPATEEQRDAVSLVHEAVVTLATIIETNVPAGQNKSLALTALEDVQMRANRGIFATGPSK